MIKKIYENLLSHFSSQNWWPVTNENSVKPTYEKRERLTERQKFEICIGAILTQNTNWKNVESAIENLNRENLIDIRKIKKSDSKKLALLIKSSGYYNQKTIKLKEFARYIAEEYKGNLKEFFKKDTEKLRNELLKIKGIGPETADSIILYAAQKPAFVIDAYTKRIFNRIGYKEETYEQLQDLFMKNLDKDVNLFGEYHALIVELGKNICKTEPLCEKCPIKDMCSYFQKQ
ncbi:MAG: endonuclease III domain-containing protein [archaeon]